MDQLPASVLAFLKEKLGITQPVISVEPAKSAQQTVLILQLLSPACISSRHALELDDLDWNDALVRGRNRLVVRIWKGSARWWDLNRNSADGLQNIAQDELAGYRLARLAFLHNRNNEVDQARPYIPQVLHRAPQDTSCGPWAIMEYVGQESTLFQDASFDESWCQSMVVIRHEFGFDEPHPRWGRVPVDRAIQYAMTVLQELIIPLHQYFRNNDIHTLTKGSEQFRFASLDATAYTAYTFQSLLDLCKSALKQLQQAGIATDPMLYNAISQLEHGISTLDAESRLITILPPTLVHMDCQPQNILFAKTPTSDENIALPHIVSVLDWEEAAIADPRFELLMLGRKICANRQQANVIWETYSKHMQTDLGSIDPWLQLETIHSLTTLILQSMNMLNGSRSPWESKPDLMQKIERELRRLSASSSLVS